MGLGWHVALQSPIAGVNPADVDGKALIHRQRDLDELARRLGVEPLSHFVSANPEALARYLAQQGLDATAYSVPEEEWFAAADGLKTVCRLRAELRSRPDAVLDSQRILRDLEAIERILQAAAAADVAFHLASTMPTLQ
jgi:hypothetical protein